MYSLKEEKISQLTPFSVLADNKRIRNKIIEGKSFQDTRSGKNLLNNTATTRTLYGINFTVNSDKTVFANGTSTSQGVYGLTNYIENIYGGKYLVGAPTGSSNSSYCLIASYYDADYKWKKEQYDVGKGLLLLSDYPIISIGILVRNEAVINNATFKPMIVDDVNTDYEPYGVSPSPEFPSEIHSLGDDVNLYDGEIKKGLYLVANGSYVDSEYYVCSTKELEVNGGDTITISSQHKKYGVYYVLELNENKEYIASQNSSVAVKDFSLTLNSSTKYILIDLGYSSQPCTVENVGNFKVQKGTVATSYSEYGKGTVEIKQCGKNLISSITKVENVLFFNGATKYEDYVFKAGTYTFSYESINVTSLYIKKKDESFKSLGSNKTITFTSNVDFNVWLYRRGMVDGEASNIQLEKETEEIEYEPYKENNYVIPTQPLRSLPNGVCDTIEEDGIHRRVGKDIVYIKGIATLANGNVGGAFYPTNKASGFEENLICSKAVVNQSYQENTVYENPANIVIVGNSTDTLETLKEKFDGAEIIYELAEEVIEPFDEEQQAIINSMETFEGVNHFSLEGDLDTTLTFDYNPQITEEIKKAFKYNITKAYLEVSATDKASGFQINEDNYLQSIDFDDCRYIEGEGVIGSCVAKELQGKFVNVDTSFDIENREVECFIGAETEDDITHYLRLGTFIVQKPENDNVKDNTSFDSLDYMIKFNKEYVHRMAKYLKTKDTDIYPEKQYYILNDSGVYEEVIVPHKEEISNYYELIDEYTLMQLLKDICEQCEVKLGTFNFRNADYLVHGNRFDSGVTCRDVLKAIAQAAFSWARINEYNELLLDFETSDTISEEIDYNEYYGLNFNDKYGPVNTIVLKNSQAEGENITIKNDELINSAGGKNLFNIYTTTYQNKPQHDLIVEDNKIIMTAIETIGAQYCINYVKNLKSSEEYTLSFKAKKTILGVDGQPYIRIVVYGSNDDVTYNFMGSVNSENLSPEENVEYSFTRIIKGYSNYRFYIYNNSHTPVTIGEQTEYYNIQFEKGSIATEYEDFTPLGTKELAISDNPFAYSEETRKAIIQAGEAIYGFKYVPLSVETIGAAYLNCKDKLKIKNMQDGDLETYVFDTRISYQGTLKSNVETLAMTDTETKYRYDGSLTTAQRRTEFRVDKAEQKITSLVKATTEQGEKFTKVEQTIEGVKTNIGDTTDEFKDRFAEIENSINGISTKLTTTGGQNLIRNSVGYFGNEYWDLDSSENKALILGERTTDVKQNSISGSALKIQNEEVNQTIDEIKNGDYFISFYYKKINPAATVVFKINDVQINLTEQEWKEESQGISITQNQIKISIASDLPNAALITDLILSEGTTKAGWSQNANESYTDNVQIGKGVKITATGSLTEFVAEANGIRIDNVDTKKTIAEFTEYGTTTEELVVNKSIELKESLLIQKIGNQVWFSSL